MPENNLETHKTSGFSLVEMMAVLLIISLMTGLVLLTRPQSDPPLQTAGKAMLRQFAQASEDSIVKGQPQGFGLYEDAYLFYEYVDGEWNAKTETPWPDELTVTFFKDEIEIEIPEEPIPVVVFEPIGLSTEFSLWLEDGDNTYILSSEGDGRVALEEDE